MAYNRLIDVVFSPKNTDMMIDGALTMSAWANRKFRRGPVSYLLSSCGSLDDVVIDKSDPDLHEWKTSVGSVPVRWWDVSKSGIRFLKIFQNYLPAESPTTTKTVTEAILRTLPEKRSSSAEIWCFGEQCLDLAEQIPYSHPMQVKLTGFMVNLDRSATFGSMNRLGKYHRTRYWSFQQLGESVVERRATRYPDNEDAYEFVNFTGFIAKLADNQVFHCGTAWAVMDLSLAHENMPEKDVSCDGIILGAAQWILWYGRKLFSSVLLGYPVGGKESSETKYKTGRQLTLQRWHMWRDCFRKVAASSIVDNLASDQGLSEENNIGQKNTEEQSLDEKTLNGEPDRSSGANEKDIDPPKNTVDLLKLAKECRDVSGKVANLMDAIEMALTI